MWSLKITFSLSFRAYFIAVAISGVFAVTFSIVFAYVADCTSEVDRSSAYGLVCGLNYMYIPFQQYMRYCKPIDTHTHTQSESYHSMINTLHSE